MQKPKAKRNLPWYGLMLPFVLIWSLSIFILGYIPSILIRSVLYHALTPQGTTIVSNTVPILLIGLIQVFLVERLLKKTMRGWLLYTTLSTIVMLIWLMVFAMPYWESLGFSMERYTLINTLAFYIPAPFVQFFWLRQHVKHAWLWPVLSTAFTLMISLRSVVTGDFPWVQILTYIIIQASLMRYFWQHPKEKEIAKLNDVETESEHERLQRLQEPAHQNPLWNLGDDDSLQSQAQ